MSVNYQNITEEYIKNITHGKNKLLLHSCCGPCSSYVIKYLSDFFDITVLYYNPNITDKFEYFHRLNEQKKLIENAHFCKNVKLIKGEYVPDDFYKAVDGYENAPEGGRRCEICFRLRLEYTARLCKELQFDYFTTTLTVSPHKNAEIINQIGQEVSQKYGCVFLPSDFKKKNGYKQSIELSRQYDLYRQRFCGCPFSITKGQIDE